MQVCNSLSFCADYHVHTRQSHDGQASVREQCLRAVEIGLTEIGFAEHKDFDPADPVVDHFVYDRYIAEVERARAEFDGALVIRLGIEVDYQQWFVDEIARFLKQHPFDYVIGSVHYAGHAMLMTPAYTEGRSAYEAYRLYYQAVRDSVISGLIDIVGHLGYANKRGVGAYGPFDPMPYRDMLSGVFEEMVRRGVALEINTAGLRQATGDLYPCANHLHLYREQGGSLLTIGSDSHRPADLALGYNAAVAAARDAGFSELTCYADRTPAKAALTDLTAPAVGARAPGAR